MRKRTDILLARMVVITILIGLNGLHDPPEASAAAPEVLEISMQSTPIDADKKTYSLGETIEIKVRFDTVVRVNGEVTIDFWIGDSLRVATYSSGHGSSSVIFAYEVMPDDKDDDGLSIQRGYIDDEGNQHGFGGGGTIKSWSNNQEVSPTYSGSGNKADHKVDGSLAPWVTDVEIASTPASGDTYRFGETIKIDVTFSVPVRVDSTQSPYINITMGTSLRAFPYSNGSGTRTLRLTRTVSSRDRDDDGFRVNGVAPNQMRGIVYARDHDVRAQYVFSGFEAGNGHKVNGQPYIKNVAITSSPDQGRTYRRTEVIEVTFTFDQTVKKIGQVTKGLLFTDSSGAAQRWASYASGSGTKALIFEYTVQSQDKDNNGLTVLSGSDDSGWDGDGSIWSSHTGFFDIEFDPTHDAINNASNHKVNGELTITPTISSIEIVTDPGDDSYYVADDWIGVKVTFDENVVVTGTPQLALRMGTQTKIAQFGQGSFQGSVSPNNRTASPTVFFGYKVQEGDIDRDGIAIWENKLTLNGGTIKDERDNVADLSHERLTRKAGHKVDAVVPTVSAITFSSDPGDDATYAIGDSIEVTVTFSEDITITGAPQLELAIGNTTKTATYDTTEGAAAVFSSVIVEGDNDWNGMAIDADKLTLNGGTIGDEAGNDADLSHEAVAVDAGHKVDGVFPTFKEATILSPGNYVNVYFKEAIDVPAILRTISSQVNVNLGQFYIAVMRVKVDGDVVRPSSASLHGTILRLNLNPPVTQSQSVRVDYNNIFARDAVGLFIDRAGNPLANFGTKRVWNQSQVADAEESNVPKLVLSLTELTVTEGESETYTVTLEKVPSDSVSVNISSSTTKLSVSPASLAFATDNWDTAQTVTLSAVEDSDDLNYWVLVTHTGSGGGYEGAKKWMRVVIDDDD